MSPPAMPVIYAWGEAHCTQLRTAVGSRPDIQPEEPKFHPTEMKYKTQLKKGLSQRRCPSVYVQLLETSHF